MRTWVGVDVGGMRKGFDLAVVDDRSVFHLAGRLRREEVVEVAESTSPVLVAIDSPRRCASAGGTTRDGERALARAVCGIRWTPDTDAVNANPYYGWILEGLRLYAALDAVGRDVIEAPLSLCKPCPRRSRARRCLTVIC